MQEFNALRKQARDKRDKLINEAREAYAATLTRIACLEQDLLGRDPVAHKSIASCIERVIPVDRQFTTVDIFASLEALDPRRNWHKRSIDNHLSRLREKGLVKRLRASKDLEPAIYCRAGVNVDSLPVSEQVLAEAVAGVMANVGKPLNVSEIAVHLLSAGFKTNARPRSFRILIGKVLKAGKYRNVGGKWVVS